MRICVIEIPISMGKLLISTFEAIHMLSLCGMLRYARAAFKLGHCPCLYAEGYI